MVRVRWSPNARDDLRGIADFVRRDSLQAARSLTDRILGSTERLSSFPESGRICPEFPTELYREVIVGSYRVIYRVQESNVWIVAVVHGARELEREMLRD